jgi:hypothetical protein
VNSFFPDRAIRRFDILEFVQQEEAHKSEPTATPNPQRLLALR